MFGAPDQAGLLREVLGVAHPLLGQSPLHRVTLRIIQEAGREAALAAERRYAQPPPQATLDPPAQKRRRPAQINRPSRNLQVAGLVHHGEINLQTSILRQAGPQTTQEIRQTGKMAVIPGIDDHVHRDIEIGAAPSRPDQSNQSLDGAPILAAGSRDPIIHLGLVRMKRDQIIGDPEFRQSLDKPRL
ncbi:MAG: hypothetical protein A2X37_05050 [Elusimicrobia bacterium GWA2_66_18]|nr:MAG: hypothetical protein A2X37_05050 [Elusimicrobia bacterium GWA2_66_18]